MQLRDLLKERKVAMYDNIRKRRLDESLPEDNTGTMQDIRGRSAYH